ncbi:hypothetical protein H4R99_005085 [Coemansia sp. RSA 1722]|nr:hypothetical protein H4R99_005085 [Coemansia sp. RSA 1722]
MAKIASLFFSSALGLQLVCALSKHGRTFRPVLRDKPMFDVYKVSATMRSKHSSVVSLEASIDIATNHLADRYGIDTGSVKITDAYTDAASGISHVYVCQLIDGVPVANGLANVNVNSMGQVISSGQSFAALNSSIQMFSDSQNIYYSSKTNSYVDHSVSLKSALEALAAYTDTQIDSASFDHVDIKAVDEEYVVDKSCSARRVLIQNGDAQIVPVWHVVWQQQSHWWSAHVGAIEPRIESVSDWVYSLQEEYKVLSWSTLTPADGQPQILVGPADQRASPNGWMTSNTTIGNNAWAQTNPTGSQSFDHNYRPMATTNVSQTAVFDFPLDLSTQPAAYTDFAIAQLFYTVNMMHDLAFLYGFDEAAGNFQDVNYSGQGKGGDAVIAFAQDAGSMSNAQFTTPPDGKHGIMQMYLWNNTTPNRDGSLEQDIVVHEFTHGISARLTGGPSNADCLNGGEPGGMGEGWSDAVANVVRIRPNHVRTLNLKMGEYVYGSNIRTYPYSTSMQDNPLTYGMLNDAQLSEVHKIGEVWASMLYEMMWNLIDTLGIAQDLFSRDLAKGNCLFLQIVIDAMKLQPCNPDFIQARNAIIQAEDNKTGGKNKCSLWRAFAKRGLGEGAFSDHNKRKEDFAVPKECSI